MHDRSEGCQKLSTLLFLLTLAWVPGQRGHSGNVLARAGDSTVLVGLEPLCGLRRTPIKNCINQWMLDKSQGMVE